MCVLLFSGDMNLPNSNCCVVLSAFWGTAVAQWLRCCATIRKVAGSIPAGVSGIFIDIKSFRSHYDPGGSTQPLTKKHFLEIKAAGA